MNLDLPGIDARVVPPTVGDMERFWNKVKQDSSGCWLWSGSCDGFGYGKFTLNRRTEFAHRLAWRLVNGAIPDGAWILHRCDVPNCVRPDHLFAGTPAENSADMMRKGRCGTAKLNPNAVREIRAHIESGASLRAIGRQYGVDRRTISFIRDRKVWGHVV